MINKMFIWFMSIIFLVTPINAFVNMSKGVFMGDNNFDYTVNSTDIVLTNLSVTQKEVFLDEVPFCSFVDRGLFFTIRDCDGLRNWEPAVVIAIGLPIVYLMMMLFKKRKDEQKR